MALALVRLRARRGPISWDAELTRFERNEVIAWKSIEGSRIPNAGVIRFVPEGRGTRIDVRISYTPPGGAIGHAFVAALGADPTRQLEADLLRFKSLLESGKATGGKRPAPKEEGLVGEVLSMPPASTSAPPTIPSR